LASRRWRIMNSSLYWPRSSAAASYTLSEMPGAPTLVWAAQPRPKAREARSPDARPRSRGSRPRITMSASHIPEPRDLDLRTAGPDAPIRVGRCHEIADRRSEVREAHARTPRLAIPRSASRDPEARGARSLTSRPTITRLATHCYSTVQVQVSVSSPFA
jgi:hypothetical protein